MSALADNAPLVTVWLPPKRTYPVIDELVAREFAARRGRNECGSIGAPALRRQRRLRFIERHIPESQRRLTEHGFELAADAILDERPLQWYVERASNTIRLPADVNEKGTLKNKQRTLRWQLAKIAYREHCRTHAGKPIKVLVPEFFATHPQFAELRCTPRSFLRRLANPGDGRCRSGRPKGAWRDSQLVLAVKTFLVGPEFGPKRHSVADAYDMQLTEAGLLGIEPLNMWQCQAISRELLHSDKVFGREGPRAFEAKCVPKVRVSYDNVSAGAWGSLDGRNPDVWLAVPDGKGGWRTARPTVIGILDLRSGTAMVEVGWSENADLVNMLLARWFVERGIPEHLTFDNGSGFAKALGTPKQRWTRKISEPEKFEGVLERCSIQRHRAIPYSPWSKGRQECWWRLLKNQCDRWLSGFCGGTPGERPFDLADTPAALLPRLDEFERMLQDAVAILNSTPRRALGGLTPNQAFAQWATVKRIATAESAPVLAGCMTGPHRVRGGCVSWRSSVYEIPPDQQRALDGRGVYVMPDLRRGPEGKPLAGRVVLCDAQSRPLAYATQRALLQAGATLDDLRAAQNRKARVRRTQKEANAERFYELQSTPQRVLREKRERLARHEDAVSAKLDAPPSDAIVVRGDVAGAAASVAQKDGKRRTRDALRRLGAGGGRGDRADAAVRTAREALQRIGAEAVADAPKSPRRADFARYADDSAAIDIPAELPRHRYSLQGPSQGEPPPAAPDYSRFSREESA